MFVEEVVGAVGVEQRSGQEEVGCPGVVGGHRIAKSNFGSEGTDCGGTKLA